MKSVTKVMMFDDEGNKFFGEGPASLLKSIEEKGSLRMAAQEMGMAYTKALKIIKNAEESLGFKLTERKIGGKAGGGSTLTDQGRRWLEEYEAFSSECIRNSRMLFVKHFGNLSCVILASGLGKRFGGNKLMADLNGRPVISYIIESTEGIFKDRVVVTRNSQVKEFCEEKGIRCILHDMPGKNDSVRLGIEAVADSEGCMMCQADQPLLSSDTVLDMAVRFTEDKEHIFTLSDKSPAVFPDKYYESLKNLPYDKGGKVIIKENSDSVISINPCSDWETEDIDTWEDLEKIRAYIDG